MIRYETSTVLLHGDGINLCPTNFFINPLHVSALLQKNEYLISFSVLGFASLQQV